MTFAVLLLLHLMLLLLIQKGSIDEVLLNNYGSNFRENRSALSDPHPLLVIRQQLQRMLIALLVKVARSRTEHICATILH